MMKNLYWFFGGILLTCLLGAANAKFKVVLCEGVGADKYVTVGEGAGLTVDKDSSALTLVSQDGKTSMVLGVSNNGKVIIQAINGSGKKVTYFNP